MDNLENIFSQNKPDKDSVVVRYLITTKLDPVAASIRLCKEQSLSNALGDDLEVIKRFSAKYIPSSIKKVSRNQFEVEVSFPSENCENSLSMILSAAGGDTYNIKGLCPIKILSIALPAKVIRHYGGPRYGINGIRKKLNIYGRPILIGPVKPCIGLSPTTFARRAKEALLGGADIVKDDELICNPSYNPLRLRVSKTAKATREAQKITGEKKMYFTFIGSGTPAEMMKYARIAKEKGADGFMISPAINGFEVIKELKDRFKLPIIAHNAFVYSAHAKNSGISFSIFAYLQRICGADIVITPAKYGTFDVMTNDEFSDSISVLLKSIPGIIQSYPAFCGGQSVRTIPMLRKSIGNDDFMVVAGVALYDHPQGPSEGARLLRQALTKR